jgi:predicted dehydrogenase
VLDYVDTDGCAYDRICQLHVKTESNLVGSIIQDVITEPSRKWARIQGDKGFVEWHINYRKDEDRIFFAKSGAETQQTGFTKKRPDDFAGEIDHIDRLLSGADAPVESPIYLDRGLETMLVVAASHMSARAKRPVHIDYTKGWTEKALST